MATPSTTKPTTTSTSFQTSTWRTLTRTWASTGLVSVKSSVPSRTSSMKRARLGWTTSWVIPETRV